MATYAFDRLTGKIIVVICHHKQNPSNTHKQQGLFFNGSSKSMDSTGSAKAVETMVTDFSLIPISVIHDSDSTALLAMKNKKLELSNSDLYKNNITPDLEEQLCTRHGTGHAGKDIVKSAKMSNVPSLSKENYKFYIMKSMRAILEKHEGNAEAISKSISNIVEHLCGDHSHCDFLPNNEEYVCSVPIIADKDDDAKKILQNWAARWSQIDVCRKYQSNYHTQIAETTNDLILMFENKRVFHFNPDNAENASYLAAGVKNEGPQFQSRVLNIMGLDTQGVKKSMGRYVKT